MKKIYTVITIIVILIVISVVYFKFSSNSDVKSSLQNYISTNYSEEQLPSANDKLVPIVFKNPELYSTLVFEAVAGQNRQSMPYNKVYSLLSTLAYSASKGRNEKVFDNLARTILELVKSDPQNQEHYLYNIEYYFVQSTMACAKSEVDFRSDSMIEQCREKNTPYVLVYNSLGKYGDIIDKKLLQCATNLTLNDGVNRGVLFPHYWVLALRQRYGNNITTEILKNDPIIQKIGGNIPNELKKELEI